MFRLTDPFGSLLLVKSILMSVLGVATYRRLNIMNKTQVIGAEHLLKLPPSNVMFVSNHETYYMDVIAMYHVFFGAKRGSSNIDNPIYLLSPKVNVYYIAAEETMRDSGWLPRIFAYTGAITIKRSWRHKDLDVKRGGDRTAFPRIRKALSCGWVVNFPQGTTAAGAPIRKEAASMIKHLDPVVVPVKIDGFRRAFGKKGLSILEKKVPLTITFLEPVQFGQEVEVDEIQAFLEKVVLKRDEPLTEKSYLDSLS